MNQINMTLEDFIKFFIPNTVELAIVRTVIDNGKLIKLAYSIEDATVNGYMNNEVDHINVAEGESVLLIYIKN